MSKKKNDKDNIDFEADSSSEIDTAMSNESVSEELETDSEYLDDDLEFLSGDDEQIFLSKDTGIFKQEEGVISWEIVNLYKDNGSPRNKYSLKSQPPLLRVSTNNGESVDFMMTKEFTKTLNTALNDANKAFYGVQPESSKKNTKEKINGYKEWVLDNKIKSSVLGLILVALVVLAII